MWLFNGGKYYNDWFIPLHQLREEYGWINREMYYCGDCKKGSMYKLEIRLEYLTDLLVITSCCVSLYVPYFTCGGCGLSGSAWGIYGQGIYVQ